MFQERVIYAFLLFISLSDAQVIGLGPCPNVQTQKDFDVKEYLGDWYEIYKFKAKFEDGQKCIKANYLLKEDGHIRVFNQGKTDNGELITAEGDGFSPDKNEPAKLLVKFTGSSPYGNYWVVDTDYDNYSLVFSCRNGALDSRYEYAWILSRQKTISDDLKKRLFKTLEYNNVSSTVHFKPSVQLDPICAE